MLHEFPDDFYGAELYVCVTGYLREEMKFNSLGTRVKGNFRSEIIIIVILIFIDELIQAIQTDIRTASQRLEEIEMKKHVARFEEYVRT